MSALLSGFLGAGVVTLLNEVGRRTIPHAPRLDVLGERSVQRLAEAVGCPRLTHRQLYRWAMAGDLISNSLYYSLVATDEPEAALRRGALFGLGAGVGAAVLPPYIGLAHQPNEQAPTTHLLTVLWYVTGGLAAAAAYRALETPAGRPE